MTSSTVTAGVTPAGRTQKVTQLNGHEITVYNPVEKKFFNEQKDGYQKTYAFTERSDLNDLDRLLIAELQVFRMTRWLANGRDYDDVLLHESQVATLTRSMKEANAAITAIKADLGMSRASRESTMDSVPEYLKDLQRRAKEFGVNREKQLDKALGLMLQIRSTVHTYYRSNENERQRTGITTAEDLVKWLRDEVIPEYDAVDAHFREHQQKLWVGKL